MKRVNWKLPFIHSVFFKKRLLYKNFIKNVVLRHSVIPYNLNNKRMSLYNGIWYLSKDLNHTMAGYKFGQFAFSKRSDTQLHLKFKSKKKSKKKK